MSGPIQALALAFGGSAQGLGLAFVMCARALYMILGTFTLQELR